MESYSSVAVFISKWSNMCKLDLDFVSPKLRRTLNFNKQLRCYIENFFSSDYGLQKVNKIQRIRPQVRNLPGLRSPGNCLVALFQETFSN